MWTLLALALCMISTSAVVPTPPLNRVRPTPAPTSTLAPRLDLTRFPRTEVHVMEKCCPWISHFAVRDYPSALEDDGWMPGLTFHAFKYNAKLPNCWEIVVNATNGSQRWRSIPSGSKPSFPAQAFCLPTENLIPNSRSSVFYIEHLDTHASFVSQPIRHVSRFVFDKFVLSGWNTTISRPTFTRIFPLAYYYWRPLQPLPQRLITDVQLHAADPTTPLQCPKGYDQVAGNLNHNFVRDPVVCFCVQYDTPGIVDPRSAVALQQLDTKSYLTDMTIQRTKPQHPDNPNGFITAKCAAPLEVVASHLDLGINAAKVNAFQKAFAQLQKTINYSVFTGTGEWLTFCMVKKPLMDENGRYRPASEFVEQLYLNLSQIVRRKRLGLVYNVDASEDTKQSPFGRLYYEDED